MRQILLRHVLPNIMAPMIVIFTVTIGDVIIAEASLSFLGMGIPPPTPSWGRDLFGAARQYAELAPWMAIAPGVALSLAVYGFNLLGDAVRDVLDPRLRGA
jgi:peptide/nickel transport system permease protein